ncbi:MAG: hypothetical protein EXR94_10980 [Gemmatimonadetes bacterium]|nr:hypothetical protein [Gemmatimonadota bacterium]
MPASGTVSAARPEFDVSSGHGARHRGTVKVDASDGRAVIEINGENGEELFRLRADDNGVSINARDKRGRTLLKLLAAETGVQLNAEKP